MKLRKPGPIPSTKHPIEEPNGLLLFTRHKNNFHFPHGSQKILVPYSS